MGTTHTGEIWTGTTAIPNNLINEIFVENPNIVPAVQMAIFAESGTEVYYSRPDCGSTGPTGAALQNREISSRQIEDIDWWQLPAADWFEDEEEFEVRILTGNRAASGNFLTFQLFESVDLSSAPNVINISGTRNSTYNIPNILKSPFLIPGRFTYTIRGGGRQLVVQPAIGRGSTSGGRVTGAV